MKKLLYPPPLFGSLPAAALTTTLEKVHEFSTEFPMGYQIPFRFDAPVRLLVRVSSRIGTEKEWVRAGHLAQVLYGLPGDPKKEVARLYLDEGFFEFDGAEYPYYFEFWAYRWLTDWSLEVWAELSPLPVVRLANQSFTINGETFTINGVPLIV